MPLTACREPATRGLALERRLKDKLFEHTQYMRKHGRDMPEIRNWQWPAAC